MASSFVDISILGDKALSRALAKLPDKAQTKALRPALRKSAKRVHVGIIQAFSGFPIGVVTGAHLTAIAAQQPKLMKKRTGHVGYFYPHPSWEDIGETRPANNPPPPAIVLEYGTDEKPALSPVRSTVNRVQGAELATIGRDVAKGIDKQWARLAKTA